MCIDPAVRPEEEITDITDDLPDLCDGEVNEDEFLPLGATPTDFQGNDENDDNSDYYMVEKVIYQRDSNQEKTVFLLSGRIFPLVAIHGLMSPITTMHSLTCLSKRRSPNIKIGKCKKAEASVH